MGNNSERTICDILRFEGVMSNGFGLAPRIVMRDKRLTVEAKAIYCYFQSFAGNSDQAFPKRQTILEDLGMSKDRYYRHLQLLIDCDYIRVERQKDENNWKGRNIYTVVANPQACNEDTEMKKPEPGERKKTPKPRMKSPTGKLYTALEIDRLIKEKPEDKADILKIFTAIKDLAAADEVVISKSTFKKETVLEKLELLSYKNVAAVLVLLKENRANIKNKRRWIQSCLLNSLYDSEADLEKIIAKGKRKEKKTQQMTELAVEKDYIYKEHPAIAEQEDYIRSLLSQRAKMQINGNVPAIAEIDKKVIAAENTIREYAECNGLDADQLLSSSMSLK